MLLATAPILSYSYGQGFYRYKNETQWKDHLKEQCVKDTGKGNSISQKSITEVNSIQNK